MRRIVARCAGDAAAGMGAGAAHIEPIDRAAVIAVSQNRTRREHLIEIELSVHDVAAGKAEDALEIERAQRLHAEYRFAESRRETVNRVNHQSRNFIAVIVPGTAARKFRRDVLAEQARHMLSRRRQRVVHD